MDNTRFLEIKERNIVYRMKSPVKQNRKLTEPKEKFLAYFETFLGLLLYILLTFKKWYSIFGCK